jgi:hypothetical protein
MGKEHILPITALAIILLGAGSTLYVNAIQIDSDMITIYDQAYTFDQLVFIAESRSLETFQGEEFSGLALDDLVRKAGVPNLEKHEYTIIGADGYQKTVSWEHMQDGVLTKERMVVFSQLAKAFRVKDVVTIEAVE